MIKGNIGEWSELYAVIKIIADGKVTLGDEDHQPITNLVFTIIDILKEESFGTLIFGIGSNISVLIDDMEQTNIPIEKFKEASIILLNALKSKTDTSFSIPDLETFIKEIKVETLKSNSDQKNDIKIRIHDTISGSNPLLGFNVKSMLGSPSTLLNAGKTTNFIYHIANVKLNHYEANRINLIDTKSKVVDRLHEIQKLNGDLIFEKTENNIFGNNLTLIDSAMPKILAEMLLMFYIKKISGLKNIVEFLEQENPLNFDKSANHPFYGYKIKKFLVDTALGMMPSKVWEGKLESTGGYLVVKETGDIVCYNVYFRNEFENYLLKNTRLETASTTRHDFAKIYFEDGKWKFKLNLQVRFK
jgi:hypothetical protein